MISIGRVLAGRYQINGFIGEGGMSRVWRALDQNTGKNVAVKVLREEYADFFRKRTGYSPQEYRCRLRGSEATDDPLD